jgi:hypothetical protein
MKYEIVPLSPDMVLKVEVEADGFERLPGYSSGDGSAYLFYVGAGEERQVVAMVETSRVLGIFRQDAIPKVDKE